MMKLRFSSKQRKVILIIVIPVVYVISTVVYLPDFLTRCKDIGLFTGSSITTRNKTSTLMKSNNVAQERGSATVRYDKRFVEFLVFTLPAKSRSKRKYVISWVNKPYWLNIPSVNNFLQHRCVDQNCMMTENKLNDLNQSDALLFNAIEKLPDNMTEVFENRPSYQVWVFFQMEPPSRIATDWFRKKIFRNSFNWSWSYRLDADVFRPIGTLKKRIGGTNFNYKAIFQRKTKMAAWVVSHCITQSRREEFVSSLTKAGIDVDIFGSCSNARRRENSSYIMKTISQEYKFYLAFENSFCEDYITEKFFTYYGLDVILIVRGGVKYANFFDKSTFIDTSDFASVKDLANFILDLSSSEDDYTTYLRNKDRFVPGYSQYETIAHSSCQLCSKLNNANRYFKIYDDISISVARNTCFQPNDNH